MDYDDAQIMMTLAAISYAPCQDIPSLLAPQGTSQNAANGQWPVVWGPAVTRFDQGNLLFVSRNVTTGEYAIAVRGTYPSFGLAMLVDLYEDFDVSHPDPWRYPDVTGALVAGGALDGLNDLLNLTWQGTSFSQFAISEILKSGRSVHVTGHSLGGALATVLTGWLAYQGSKEGASSAITTYTFAAPTAGNSVFANWFSSTFPNSFRYYNDLDVIPRAWQQIMSIKGLFPSPGPSCSLELRGAIDLVNGWLDLIHVGYVHTNGTGSVLPGAVAAAGDFLAECLDQHDHNYYLKLLGAPTIPVIAPGAASNSRAAALAATAAVSQPVA